MTFHILWKAPNAKIVLRVLLATVCLTMIAVACLLEWANLHAARAYVLMDKWEREKAIKDPSEWREALVCIETARRFNPLSVDYIIEHGQLYEWAGELFSFPSDQHRVFQLAKNSYRLAVVKRPTWPHGWANLAYAKMVCDEWDDELFLAVSKAVAYGPWIKEAQKKAILIGLTGWDILPGAARDALMGSIKGWLTLDNPDRHMEQYILRTAVETNHTYVINRLLTETRQRKFVENCKADRYASHDVLKQVRFPVHRFKERFEV